MPRWHCETRKGDSSKPMSHRIRCNSPAILHTSVTACATDGATQIVFSRRAIHTPSLKIAFKPLRGNFVDAAIALGFYVRFVDHLRGPEPATYADESHASDRR